MRIELIFGVLPDHEIVGGNQRSLFERKGFLMI